MTIHMHLSRHLSVLAASTAIAAATLMLPATPTHASLCINLNCPPPSVGTPAVTDTSQFAVMLPTPVSNAAYQAVYSLTPVGWTKSIGTVYFYLGPAADTTAQALEAAALNAPDFAKADVQHELGVMNEGGIDGGSIDTPTTNVQLDGAQPACGNNNQICQRYESMKYCMGGSTTSSGDGGCSDASRTVDGVFSYDYNGAYASDNGPQGGDFVDCSQATSTSYTNAQTGATTYDSIDLTWCGYWNQGPWSDPNSSSSFMDYGMNVKVNNNDSSNYTAWIRMDDYAGCGSVGNRGGTSN